MELVFHLQGRALTFFDGARRTSIRGPLLAGLWSRSFLIEPSEYTAVLGVRFRPGAARMFFPIPADELHNSDIALGDAYPFEAGNWFEQLCEASEFGAQVALLERLLMEKLCTASPLHPAVEYGVRQFLRSPGTRTVAHVQSETGLSHTRFIHLFKQNVGVTPKLFCRIQRFRTVIQQVESARAINWAAIAIECGYFDQAHMIHDFRTFAGITPAMYHGSARVLARPSTASA